MTRPRLLILSFSPITSDARLLKQIAALRDRFEVTTFGYGPRPAGVHDHLQIPDERVYWRYDRRMLMLRQYRRAYWSNPAVGYVKEALERGTFDVILANDIDTVGLALDLEPRMGVHADLHEYAPRVKEDVPRWRLFVAPFMGWMCRTFLPRVASITTVGGGIAREYERTFGVQADVVTNSAPYAALEPTPVGSPIRLVHSGVGMPARGLGQLVEAVRRTSSDVTLDLYLMPNDAGYLEQLRAETAGDARIRINDPLPYDRLVATLNAFDVGVTVLPPLTFNIAWSLPNKFFDFVQARLGIVVGPSPEMKTLVQEGGFGAVTDDFEVDALVRVLDALSTDQVAQWKAHAHAAARDLSADAQGGIWRHRLDDIVRIGSV